MNFECQFNETVSTEQFNFENYKLIPQGKPINPCSAKGGLIIYLHDNFKGTTEMTLNTYSTWEAQIIKVTNNGLKKLMLVRNINRPPRDTINQYNEFIREITPILGIIESRNMECFLTGDTNINLLDINERQVVADFFDILTENMFYPKITLPTRFSKKRGTRIDNLFCKLTEKTLDTTSGILTLKVSDHQPYFIFINNINPEETQLKYIKINLQTKAALQSF